MQNAVMVFENVKREYKRNNRSNNMKALRCFPRCKEGGHCKWGFCGTPLRCSLEVQLNQESPRCQHHDEFWRGVTCVAQFLDTQEASLPNSRYLSRQSIQSQYRTRLEKFKTLLEGKTIAVRSQHHSSENVTKLIDLEFNSQRQAWHYGWNSHKYKKDTKHCVNVLVLVDHGSDGFYVAASFMSPPFEIMSTKTDKKNGENLSSLNMLDLPVDSNQEQHRPRKKAKKEPKDALTERVKAAPLSAHKDI